MKTIQNKIPDTVYLKESDLLLYMASKLYEDAKLSLGQAAEMTGISKRAFIEILGKYNVSFFSDADEELKSNIQNAGSYN